MQKVMEGTHAASHGARLARVQVVAAYPITPSSAVVELLSEMCATGELKAHFIKVESEHSAMASCIGAAAAGARAFTATSAQGLALMHEMLHWAAGGRHPVVLVNVNRAMAPPWTIYCDQTDSLSQRDTGWIQYYCESNQEVLDTVLQAFRVAERVLLPAMINMDAFFLSHTSEPVDLPDQELVDKFLPPFQPPYRLDPAEPHSFGGLAAPDKYMELRYKMEEAMEGTRGILEETHLAFAEIFGRRYGCLEEYRLEGAEVALITSGTVTSTARQVIDEFRTAGLRVGLAKVRLFRPFPVEELRALAERVRKFAVIDRNLGLGVGGIFAQEVRAALYGAPGRPPVFGFVAGLGGRDVTPSVISEVLRYALETGAPPRDLLWIGVTP